MSFGYTPQIPADTDVTAGRRPVGCGSAGPQIKLFRDIGRRQQVQHFLRRLTVITAIAMAGVTLGWAQNSQPAQSGQAAPAGKKPQYKDQQEYTLYDSVTKEADPNKKLALLNTWKEKYPDSDFKMARTMLFLDTYQKLGQYAKMIDIAKEVLALDPKELHALYWITLLTPQLNLNSQDGLDTGEKAANGLLAAEAPAGTKPEDWEKAKKTTDAIAYKTLGWVAWQRKAYDVAEKNLAMSLKMEPNSGEVDYWLGTVIYLQKKPERLSEAMFYFARAAAFDGPGAMLPQQRKQADDFLIQVYSQLHGDTSGLVELKALAKANSTPPADLKIKTAAKNQQNGPLTVRAMTHTSRLNEHTSAYTTPGTSNTNCSGTGTTVGNTTNATANCQTTSNPAQIHQITMQTLDVVNVVEAGGMQYTISCTAHWRGSNCGPMIDGDTFPAEIDGNTMWITARKGGNRGKEVRSKYRILDIRPI